MKNTFEFIELLSLSKLTETKLFLLLEKYGTPAAIREAPFEELQTTVGTHLARSIRSLHPNSDVHKKCKTAEALNVQVVPYYDTRYPHWLKTIDHYPPVLFVRGNILPQDEQAIAVIGTRGATVYGKTIAEQFAGEFADAGLTVISGMARGIDTAAHHGALKRHGRTIAVLGCGVDRCYPPENQKLMNTIISNGAVISEFNIGTLPLAQHFPKRNRIVSGLSKAVVAIEAKEKSGVMNTVSWACAQNKDVYAIPGNIYSKASHGTNRLIKDGAIPVTSTEEILQSLGMTTVSFSCQTSDQLSLSDKEKIVWDQLTHEPVYLDVLSEELEQPTGMILNTLLELELKGLVKQLPGMMFVRNFN
jgi:DNA processing protein